MSSPSYAQYAPYYSDTLPISVPAKGQYPHYYQTESTYSVSPPEGEASVSSGSGVPSYGNSGYSGYSGYSATASYAPSYAGSTHGDYESAVSASNLDINEYMHERFAETFDPLPLDKAMAVQAQTSGHLNAKHRELADLRAQAQERLAKTRARFAKGVQDAREVHKDLEWTQKKVSSLRTKASKKHSSEYSKARARYPSPEY